MPYIFKASFDKANRSSRASFRGPGMEAGLKCSRTCAAAFGVPVLTDVHEDTPIEEVAAVVDVLQTPAFLCRQTNFILQRRRPGQARQHQEGPVPLALGDAERGRQGALHRQRARSWCASAASPSATTTWSPTCARSRSCARTGCPVVFDATHSVQLPGGQGGVSGGQREFIPVLARAAVAAGVAGAVHGDPSGPEQALSDGPNAWPLARMEPLLDDASRSSTASSRRNRSRSRSL